MADSSAPKIRSLWGDERFSDATIIMGQKKWPVHRWVVCSQSKYFEKALEGHFMVSTSDLTLELKKLLTIRWNLKESDTKAIDLKGSQFLEEQVDSMLKYLYLQELDSTQKRDPIATFLVADYFQVAPLRTKATEELSKGLVKLAISKYFENFKKWCHIVLDGHPDSDLEQAVIKVIADNIQIVMHESGAWNELNDAYPSLSRKVLDVLFPKPAPTTAVKRPAGVAFDDTLQWGRSGKGHGFRPGSGYY